MDAVDLLVLGADADAVQMAIAGTLAERGDSVRVAGPRRPA
jgi:hypothetical protein